MKLIKTIYLVLLLMILLQNSLQARQANSDSLKSLLEITKGKERINIYIALMKNLQRSGPASASAYGNEALDLLEKYPDEEKRVRVYYLKGWAYIFSNKPDSVKICIDQIRMISQKSGIETGSAFNAHLESRILRNEGKFEEASGKMKNILQVYDFEDDLELKAAILNELGSVERRLGNLRDAMENHIEALGILEQTGYENKDELSTTYSYLGITNDMMGSYDEALKYQQKALELNRRKPDDRGVAAALHNIGILYQKTKKFDLALDYFQQALSYWELLGNKDALASTLNSIGGINEAQNNYPEALKYYREALDIWEEAVDEFSISIALNNIGSVHIALKQYDEALKHLNRAISIEKKLGDKEGTTSTLLLLADVYNKTGDAESAIITAKEGLVLAKEVGGLPDIRAAHHLLSRIYEDNGLYSEALEEYKHFKAAHDSMFNSESSKVIAELETKYKTDEQLRRIELLQRNTEIQNLHRTLLIAGLGLTTIIILLLYNRYRLKQQAHSTLQKFHESEIEAARVKSELLQMEFDQKKRELDSARELQLSMLPENIPDHPDFEISALMQTASEVGGDYYDFYEGPGDRLTIAIGDATGHGARASMLVAATKGLFNLLSQEDDIAEILNKMNCSVRKMHMSNLFMAMGILRLSEDKMELAGAGMPPALIYREQTGNIESIPLKGLPLGSSVGFTWSKSSTRLYKGDLVAVMSDGFAELFNDKYEMFGYDKAKQILEANAGSPPAVIIEEFKKSASKWLNGVKQQDDITFILFRKK
jgi:serine phosphatase RsbU (regulator of sigma subunit)/Tfp pilus assembly protein PilF